MNAQTEEPWFDSVQPSSLLSPELSPFAANTRQKLAQLLIPALCLLTFLAVLMLAFLTGMALGIRFG